MNAQERAVDVAAYAGAVRAALADLPVDERQALLDDLEEHLNEVAAESDVPLAERLGQPAAYAAELRTAYGAVHPARGGPGAGGRRVRDALGGWLAGSRAYRELRAFVPELRPAWWVLRAYLAVLVLAVVASGGRGVGPIPNPFHARGLLQILVTTAAIVLSIRLGRRGRPGGGVAAVAGLGLNWFIALLAVPALASMATNPGSPSPDAYPVVDQAVYAGAPLTNIYPYSRDGTPLSDVLLYDQAGNPLTVAGRDPELTTEFPTGADGRPIANAYPLVQRHLNGDPLVRPRVAIPPWPATPGASPMPSPHPSMP